ncbi:MAG TPA: hypothetical protein VGM93_12520 [Acidimicrobiales bacterium]
MRLRRLSVSAMVVAALFGSACSSGKAAPKVASVKRPATPTPAADQSVDAPKSGAERGLDWAKCMRKHGVPVSDPKGGAIHEQPGPKWAAAADTCAPLLDGPPTSPRQADDIAQAELKWVACMRKHGDTGIRDPRPDAHGNVNLGVDGSDPKVAKALKACPMSALGGGSASASTGVGTP